MESAPSGEPDRALARYEYDAASSGFAYAMRDIREGLRRTSLAATLIRAGFIQRHNGVVSAIFWTLLITVATVGGMAILWGRIFAADLQFFLPYVACGIIVWGLISSLLNGAAGVFIAARGTYTQTPMAKTLFAIRSVGIELITFLVKLVVLVGAMLLVSRTVGLLDLVLAVAGLSLILITGFSLCLSLGVLGARFRDVPNLTSVALTFAFFLTPVFWTTDRLGDWSWVVKLNPLYHYLNIFRGPLMGLDGTGLSFAVAGGVTAASAVIGWVCFGLFARRLNYWA
ncbi:MULTISPECIES: ABC transporter permease [Hyphobacterium]|uniref:ABC transporter permease n=1 Tax=Hyphobacterium vulgare TaxID=1736751 RepID=A0ABV6ZVK1_9PROT